MAKRVIYQIRVEPVLAQKERTSPDKYLPTADAPQTSWAAPKIAQAAALLAALTASAFVLPASKAMAAEHVNPDKYHPQIEQPRFDLKRSQYLYPAAPTESGTEVAALSQLRYSPPSPGPQLLVFRRGTPASRISEPVFTATGVHELTTAAKWHPSIEQPQFDSGRRQYLYPAPSSGPISNVWRAVYGPDLWSYATETPRFDQKRQQQSSAPYASDAGVAGVTSRKVYAASWHPEISQPRFDQARAQYLHPVHAEPVSKTWAEHVSIDKFHPSIEQPQFDQRRLQSVYPIYASDDAATVSDLAKKNFADRWHPAIETPRFDPARTQYLFPFQTGPVSTVYLERSAQPDKWAYPVEQPQFDLGRRQYLYPTTIGAVSNVFVPLVVGTSLSTGETDNPVYDPRRTQAQHLFPGQADAPVSPLFLPSIQHGWDIEISRALGDTPRRPHLYQDQSAGPIAPVFAELVSADRWAYPVEQPQFDLGRRQNLYPDESAGPIAPFYAELNSADRWHPSLEQPQFDLGRRQNFYPDKSTGPVSPAFATLYPDRWAYPVEQPQFDQARKQYLHPAHAGPVSTSFAELVTVDEWAPLANQPLFDAGRRQQLYPHLSSGPEALIFAELVTADDWAPLANEPLFDAARRQNLYPDESAGPIAPFHGELNSADRWHPSLEQPQFDLGRRQNFYPDESAGPIAPIYVERTTPDKFLPLDNQPLFDLARQQNLYPNQSFGPVSSVFPERVTPERWADETEQPQFDIARRQATYPADCEIAKLPSIGVEADSWHPGTDLLPRVPQPRHQHLYEPVSRVILAPAVGADLRGEQARELVRNPDRRAYITHGEPVFTAAIQAKAVLADSYFQATERPRFEPSRGQYLHSVHSGPVAPTANRVVAPFDYGATPVFRTQNRSYLGEGNPAFIAALNLEFAFPDNWLSDIAQPRFDRARTQHLNEAQPFVQALVPAHVDAYWQQPSEPVRRQDHRGYQISGDAVFTAAVAGKLVLADNCYAGIERPRFEALRLQALYEPYASNPLPRASTIRGDWYQPLSEPVRLPDVRCYITLDSVYPLGAAFGLTWDESLTSWDLVVGPWGNAQFGERPSPDKWHPAVEQPLFDSKRLQALYEPHSYDPEPFPDRIFADRWAPLSNQPVFDAGRRQQLYPASSAPELQPKPRPESWFAAIEAPRFDQRRLQALYEPSFAPEIPTVNLPAPDKWWQAVSEPVRRPDNRNHLTVGELELANAQRAERVSPERWADETEQPQFDAKRIQAVYEPSSADTLPLPNAVFPESWWLQSSEPARATDTRSYVTGGELLLSAAQRAEATSIDRWHPPIEQSLFDLARQQFQHLAHSGPVSHGFVSSVGITAAPDRTVQVLLDDRRITIYYW